jgi:hypothetical protein
MFLAEAILHRDPIFISHLAGMTGVCHQAQHFID